MESRTIDWEAIHQRLAHAADAVAGGLTHDPEETRRVLEARARAAATPPASEDDAERLEVLAFSLATELYAVETCHVREVCPLESLTAVPCTPPFIAGVMASRGRILAIVDLRRFFELPSAGITELDQVIVLSGGGHELGLLADSVGSVRSLEVSELQGGLPTLTGIRERFLRGVTARMLAVLDGGRLLSDAGLEVDDRVIR